MSFGACFQRSRLASNFRTRFDSRLANALAFRHFSFQPFRLRSKNARNFRSGLRYVVPSMTVLHAIEIPPWFFFPHTQITHNGTKMAPVAKPDLSPLMGINLAVHHVSIHQSTSPTIATPIRVICLACFPILGQDNSREPGWKALGKDIVDGRGLEMVGDRMMGAFTRIPRNRVMESSPLPHFQPITLFPALGLAKIILGTSRG